MIQRREYISKISPYMGKPVVKAIVGLRRVGKSIFIRQLMDSLVSEGVPEQNILYVDMESLKFDFIRTYLDLNRYVEKQTVGIKGKIHVFIDEIQDITNWEKTIASWSGEPDRYDVTISGSNSTMFSSGLATKLTGRYIEFPVYPLSLREFKRFSPDTIDSDRLFERYLRFGGLPGLHTLNELNEAAAFPFLEAIHNTIVLKDIVDRSRIRNVSTLRQICHFAYDNIGQIVNANSICRYLKSQHLDVNVQTVINYLDSLVEAQLFYRVSRYDIKGRRQLELNHKYFATDLGLRNAQIGFRTNDIAQMIENLVYFELCRRGYRVYVGQWDKYEIDFVSEKHGKPHYWQVTMRLDEASVIERETRALLAIDDNFPKTIISMTPAFGDGIKGIEVLGLMDFLMQEMA